MIVMVVLMLTTAMLVRLMRMCEDANDGDDDAGDQSPSSVMLQLPHRSGARAVRARQGGPFPSAFEALVTLD